MFFRSGYTKLFSICSIAFENSYSITKRKGSGISNLQFQLRYYYSTRITPNEVTLILRANENSEDINIGSIKSFDTNQLASNSPIEDVRAEARCLLTTGMLFGILDGHGGPACAQVVSKRLFNYIAASLLPSDILHKILNPVNTEPIDLQILDTFNDRYDMVGDLQVLYNKSFQQFLHELALRDQSQFLMRTELERAFVRLDNHIMREAKGELPSLQDFQDDENLIKKTISVALSGAVAAVAHIDSEHLHVASCGDCQVVLGTRISEADDLSTGWVAVPLTQEHNAENEAEVQRILQEHPEGERDKIIVNERLLGSLAPLRAFGDCRFKMTKDEITRSLAPFLGAQAILNNSISPPYLTAKPEVTYHRLRPKDSFIIIGSDGLWDFLTPAEAVRLVGEHMSGKTVLSPFSLPQGKDDIKLRTIHATLMRRMESFKLKPMDSNAATHLIRHALSGTDYGLDPNRLSYYLTMPQDTVRLFRDDISATVIFLDTEYLSQRPL